MNLKRTFGLLVTEMLHFPVKMLTKYAPNPFIRQNTLITGVILRSNQNNKLFVLRQAKFRCLSHKLMMMFSDQSITREKEIQNVLNCSNTVERGEKTTF
jgi:hypothetical protein